jgi:hypothetical protein
MKRWWKLWSGHVYTALATLFGLIALVFIIVSIRARDDSGAFWAFVLCALCALLALTLAALASAMWTTYRERLYWRAQWRREDANLPGVPLPTGPWISPVNGSHSAGDKG